MSLGFLLTVVVLRSAPDAGVLETSPPPTAPPVAYCAGDYADDFSALPSRVRDLEQRQQAYTFCIRTRATYECPFYDSDGNLRRTKKTAVAHGTGFAYQVQNGDTLLLTNQHVAEWPSVTDEDHRVEDVPGGCKRVSDSLKIVDNDKDDYETDDIPLVRAVTDPQLDMAVLRAHTILPTLPWKIGHSAGLRERNVVDVRGFPLGAFKATNVGKVVSAYDHDEYKDWFHDDFVIDALLSSGNSGSPVLAMSCKTGEFELVGVFHAGYTRGSALNVVVGIEQVRDMMNTLKRAPRREVLTTSDGLSRPRLLDSLRATSTVMFPFGAGAANATVRADGAIVFQVLNRDFPFRGHPILVLEDLPPSSSDSFGTPGRAWFGNASGLKSYARADLDAEAQGNVSRVLDALRHDAQATFEYQFADRESGPSRERHERLTRLERALHKAAASRQELAQQTFDLADRLAPQRGDAVVGLVDVMTVPSVAPAAGFSTDSGAPLVVGESR